MPQPNVNQVHVDAILTNMSVAYIQNKDNFIAGDVFPEVAVDKQSDKFFVYTKNDWFRDEAQRRAPGTESAGSGYTLGTDNYRCDKWAFHKDVDDDTVKNADNPLNPRREAAEFVAQRLMLRKEVQFCTDYLTTGKWANDLTGVASSATTDQFIQWSNFSTSDPLEDIEDWKERILSITGLEGNVLVLGYPVFRKLRNHPDIMDRIKHTSSENVTKELLARLFEVDRVVVAKSIRATNNEGETAAYTFNVGKIAALFHVADTPGLLTPSAGYNFAWKGVSDGLGETIGVGGFEMKHLKAERVEGEVAFDHKIIGTDLGVFATAVVA